jgi:hypothetical protein
MAKTPSYKQKKEEALFRMIKWGLSSDVIQQFADNNTVLCSLTSGKHERLPEKTAALISELEKTHHILVYHVIHDQIVMGPKETFKVDCLLYVSNYIDEWVNDRHDIGEKQQCVYVYNHTAPDCSEFGYIGVYVNPDGIMVRIW